MSKCPICNADLRQIPAGTSKKTGKPYKAFEACPNNCPKASYNAPGSPKQSFANTPDVYDVLTDIKAIVTKIWDKLSHEMPSDDQF